MFTIPCPITSNLFTPQFIKSSPVKGKNIKAFTIKRVFLIGKRSNFSCNIITIQWFVIHKQTKLRGKSVTRHWKFLRCAENTSICIVFYEKIFYILFFNSNQTVKMCTLLQPHYLMNNIVGVYKNSSYRHCSFTLCYKSLQILTP